MDANMLGEWSDPEVDDIMQNVDESDLWEWSDPEADDIIQNVDESDLWEWSDPGADDIIRNMDIDDDTLTGRGDPETDDIIPDIQMGRGEKRKSDEPLLPEKDFYVKESVKKHHSKKFDMTATNYTIRFNTVLAELDLIESYERTQAIFGHLLSDLTQDMNERDQVRFVLRSDQLDKPISLPFMTVEQLTSERLFSQFERVIQWNQDFRLNDTVTVDIIHVVSPQGSGRSKRTTLDLREYLHKKKSIISINNNGDNLCLARALVVAIAKIEKDPNYKNLINPKRKTQQARAMDLHHAAKVPFGPCGLPEVALFQKHLTNYEINIVSGNHNDAIIYPPKPSTDNNVTPIYLYYHDNHYDVITSMPGFLSKVYFCHRCSKPYASTSDHICNTMCRACRSFGCVPEGDPIVCNGCKRRFKSNSCYGNHKTNLIGTRTVCQVIRTCEKCGKAMDVRKLNPEGHICGKKCPTCKVILDEKDGEHKCYIQKLEQPEEEQYNHLLFFDLECIQEHGIHQPNLCVVHDEVGEVGVFRGKDTVKEFCEWLLTKKTSRLHCSCT